MVLDSAYQTLSCVRKNCERLKRGGAGERTKGEKREKEINEFPVQYAFLGFVFSQSIINRYFTTLEVVKN